MSEIRVNGARPRAGSAIRVASEPLRPFFTPQNLAKYLAISDRTMRQLLHDGEIGSYKVAGCRRIDPADVEDYLRTRRQRAR
jgi:excisionase family DNA binding protein